MAVYGAAGTSIAEYQIFMRNRLADTQSATKNITTDPNGTAIRIKNNNDYMTLANDIMGVILKNITQLQL